MKGQLSKARVLVPRLCTLVPGSTTAPCWGQAEPFQNTEQWWQMAEGKALGQDTCSIWRREWGTQRTGSFEVSGPQQAESGWSAVPKVGPSRAVVQVHVAQCCPVCLPLRSVSVSCSCTLKPPSWLPEPSACGVTERPHSVLQLLRMTALPRSTKRG